MSEKTAKTEEKPPDSPKYVGLKYEFSVSCSNDSSFKSFPHIEVRVSGPKVLKLRELAKKIYQLIHDELPKMETE